MTRLNLGGHVSTKDGLRTFVMNTRALDYTVVQTMLSDGQAYSPREIKPGDAAELKQMLYGVELYVHLPYVINPCEQAPQRKGFYKQAYRAFCKAASELGARGVVMHPGYRKELSSKQAMQNMVTFLDHMYDEDWNLQILLETDSGSKNGSAVGTPEFIAEALEIMDLPNHHMCLDTTHMYARGVDLWQQTTREPFLRQFRHLIKLVHFNSPDPKVTLGSFLDRHSTPFEDRPDWDHKGLLDSLMEFPLILERSSLAVQEKDARYLRTLAGDEGAVRGQYARTGEKAK